MKKLPEFICKHKLGIVILTIILLIPSLIGIYKTKINYDILVYLPSDIDTMKGQDILSQDFDMGAFSVSVIENMNSKDLLKLEDKIKKIDGVANVVSYTDFTGTTIPKEILPSEILNHISKDNTDLLLITFDESTSNEKTMNAIEQIREVTDENTKIGGMSSMVLDTKNLSDSEVVIYVLIAVVLVILVLMISLDSYAVPFILLLNIGIAILFNMGTNVFLENISYITKAISAVLQLGVTTDFSIFLYRRYEKAKKDMNNKEEAMKVAIKDTFVSVIGSSLTTIAGFLALCTMRLTLGKDIGIVMAKGVFFGVLCVLVVFPALILLLDKFIDKTKHKTILPEFTKIKTFAVKHYKTIFILTLILAIPAYYGNQHTNVYYNLDTSLPNTLESIQANQILKEKFNIISPEIILLNKDIKSDKVNEMVSEIEQIDGVDLVLSFSKLEAYGLSKDALPNDIRSIFESDNYQALLVNSTYETATDELNTQVEKITTIIKQYDQNGILAGEGPLTKDLVQISNKDFIDVNYTSIAAIFLIMLIVLKSFSLPVILVSVIEFAIFINMGIPYYMNTTLPFVASIVIGTIQLGATIDYAILMTTKYLEERKNKKDKFASIKIALDSSVSSIIVSALCFFAATIGVGVYSKLEMISSLCTLMSRGAIISMLVVILVLPSFLLVFDKVIVKTSTGFRKDVKNMNKKIQKSIASLLLVTTVFSCVPVKAQTKDETIYSKRNYYGTIKTNIVTEHISGSNEDVSFLNGIINMNGYEAYTQDGNKLTWESDDIYYQGTTNKNLPVDMQIKYFLNGEEKTLDEILGESGNVTIKIIYTNNDKHIKTINGKNQTLYTPFVVTTSTILDNDNNQNIRITNGKTVSNGTKSVILALSTPGLYESLNYSKLKGLNEVSISFETTNFKLPTIYSVATPKLLSKVDLDIFNKLDNISTNIDQLQKSTDKIQDSTKTLSDNLKVLNENLTNEQIAINATYNGVSKIQNEIIKSTEKLNKQTGAIDSNTLAYLKQTAKSKAISAIEAQKDVIMNNAKAEVESLYANETYKNQIGTEAKNNAISNAEAKGITDATTLQLIGNAAYETAIATSKQTAINTSMQTSYETAKSIASQTAELLAESIATQVSCKTTETLKTEVSKSMSDLLNGLGSLSQGLNQLNTAAIKISAGSNKLYEGSNELYEGVKLYNETGINKLTELYKNNIAPLTEKTESLIELSKEYKTFDLSSKNTNGSSKIIFTVDSKEKEKAQIIDSQVEVKVSVWQKIKHFFSTTFVNFFRN